MTASQASVRTMGGAFVRNYPTADAAAASAEQRNKRAEILGLSVRYTVGPPATTDKD